LGKTTYHKSDTELNSHGFRRCGYSLPLTKTVRIIILVFFWIVRWRLIIGFKAATSLDDDAMLLEKPERIDTGTEAIDTGIREVQILVSNRKAKTRKVC